MYYVIEIFKTVTFLVAGLSLIIILLYLTNTKDKTVPRAIEEIKKYTPIVSSLLLFSIITLPIYSGAYQEIIGIHNLYLEPDGTYCYIVEFDEKKLPAEIRVESVEGTHKSSYYLNKVILENGHELEFYDTPQIEINEMIEVHDRDYYYHTCKLLNKHGYSSKIHESDKLTVVNLVLITLFEIPPIILFYLIVKPIRKLEESSEK